MLSSHPNLEYFGDLEASMSYFLGSEQPTGLLEEEWGLYTPSLNPRRWSTFLSECCGQHEKQKVLKLTAWRTVDCYPALLCLL